MTVELTQALFTKHLHSHFRIAHAPGTISILELVAVSAGPAHPRFETFAARFRGPLAPNFPQQTYRFEHEQIGAFDLFIVPVAREENGTIYEAVFNRLAEPEEAINVQSVRR